MKNLELRRKRFLLDDLPVRLGGLAANLRRVSSFAQHTANREAVEGLLDESKHLIEWTVAEAEAATSAELVELQIQLAQWQQTLDQVWREYSQRKQFSEQSLAWSDRVLALSGLLR